MGLSRFKAPLSNSSWAIGLLGAFVSLGVFWGALEASAQGPNDWTDSRYYVECGQDCLYQKANENVTAQSLYLVKKMENLKRILEGGALRGNDDNYHQVVKELQLYCPDANYSKATVDDANLCYKRYVQTQIPVLRALKATLEKNEDMTARLKTNQGVLGAGASKHFQDETPGTRMAQTPEFKKEDELLTTKAGQERLSYLSSTAYQAWANEVSRLQPKQEDFPMTVQVRKDPSDSSSMMISQIVRDKLGNPIPDMGAFSRAQAEYKKNVLGQPNGKDLNMASVARNSKSAKGTVAAADQNLFNIAQPIKGAKPQVTDIERVSYQQARNLAVDSEAKLFARGVLHTQEFSGPRKPASAQAGSKDKTAAPPPAQGSPNTQTANTDDSTAPMAASYRYDQIVKPIADVPVKPIPAGNTNTVYSVTLSPAELGKRIDAFQADADNL